MASSFTVPEIALDLVEIALVGYVDARSVLDPVEGDGNQLSIAGLMPQVGLLPRPGLFPQ